jgi:hypothetical protein
VCGSADTALDNNWSAKFEALYVDLGGFNTAFGGVTNTTVTNALNTPQQGFNTVTTTTATTTGSFHFPHACDGLDPARRPELPVRWTHCGEILTRGAEVSGCRTKPGRL